MGRKKGRRAKPADVSVVMSGTVVQPERGWDIQIFSKEMSPPDPACQYSSDAHMAALAQASPCPDCSGDST